MYLIRCTYITHTHIDRMRSTLISFGLCRAFINWDCSKLFIDLPRTHQHTHSTKPCYSVCLGYPEPFLFHSTFVINIFYIYYVCCKIWSVFGIKKISSSKSCERIQKMTCFFISFFTLEDMRRAHFVRGFS